MIERIIGRIFLNIKPIEWIIIMNMGFNIIVVDYILFRYREFKKKDKNII